MMKTQSLIPADIKARVAGGMTQHLIGLYSKKQVILDRGRVPDGKLLPLCVCVCCSCFDPFSCIDIQ